MNVDDAIYHAVHDYKGGPAALAPRMGIAASTLQNMANPAEEAHGWNLKRFRQLLTFTGDTRPLDALCAENGGVFVHTQGFDGISDKALLETMTELCSDFGKVCESVHAALTDGKITHTEVAQVFDRIYTMNQAAAELANRMKQLEEPGA